MFSASPEKYRCVFYLRQLNLQVSIYASYIRSVDHKEEHAKSKRLQSDIEWELSSHRNYGFQKILNTLG